MTDDATTADPVAAELAAIEKRYIDAGWVTADIGRLGQRKEASCADVPRLVAALEAVLARHQPHQIYTECGHAHACDSGAERDKAGVIDCGDFVTCDDGYMYSVCRECCIDDGQTEACADGHHHDPGKPICATVADLSAALLGEGTDD